MSFGDSSFPLLRPTPIAVIRMARIITARSACPYCHREISKPIVIKEASVKPQIQKS